MNIKTNLIHEYVNFVDNTKKQNKNLWIYIIMLMFIVFILIILLFKYINEQYSFFKRNKKNFCNGS